MSATIRGIHNDERDESFGGRWFVGPEVAFRDTCKVNINHTLALAAAQTEILTHMHILLLPHTFHA